MSHNIKTTKIINQLSGLVHKINELESNKTGYQRRFEEMNYEKTDRHKLQIKIRDQLANQVKGGTIEEVSDSEQKNPDRLFTRPQDQRKIELEQVQLHIKHVEYIDEIEKSVERFELKLKDVDMTLDQKIPSEQESELSQILWQSHPSKVQNANFIQNNLSNQNQKVSIQVRDYNYVLEDDEDNNFSREINIIGDDVRSAVHNLHKQQMDDILTKSIYQMMQLKSDDSNQFIVDNTIDQIAREKFESMIQTSK